VRCLGGCPEAASAHIDLAPQVTLSLFLLLRAFASGATALTGVEAIADGVQAFRRPQSRNAAQTLTIMGAMAVTMFLGITILADALHVRVSPDLLNEKSVLAQIGETVFGHGFMFILLQIFTANVIGPIFFEIIQRKGNQGFGEGNFKALFESIELDQMRRGVLKTK